MFGRYLRASALAVILAAFVGLLGQRYASGQFAFPFSTQADGSVRWTVPQSNPLSLQRNEPIRPGGRLTATSGTPVMTGGAAGASNLFYAAYNGNTVPVFAAAQTITGPPTPPSIIAPTTVIPAFWQNLFLCAFPGTVGPCQATLALAGANWPTNTSFDVFAENNLGGSQGVPNTNSIVELCTIPWASGTARTTSLAYLDGLLVNAAANATCRISNTATVNLPINQGTYLGSFNTTGGPGQTTTIFGSAASGGGQGFFPIFNYYNRVNFSTIVTDNGATYTYSTNTTREARASVTNQVSVMVGVIEDQITASVQENVVTAAALGAATFVGIGVNSTSAMAGNQAQVAAPTAAAFTGSPGASFTSLPPQLGINVYSLNERGDGANSNTLGSTTLFNQLTVSGRL